MTDSYQIDLNAVKNNKLFKKFMQNKSAIPEHEVNEPTESKNHNHNAKNII
jgi:hypothetical protein